MGMIGCYVSVPEADIAKIEGDEDYVNELIDNTELSSLSIEKAWQAIHFVLTGNPMESDGSPLGNAVLGGREVGDDMGYGPARLLVPNEVKKTAEALEKISTEEFAKRIPKSDFANNDIYVFSGEDPEDEDIIEELSGYYTELRTHFQESAARGDGMLLYIG